MEKKLSQLTNRRYWNRFKGFTLLESLLALMLLTIICLLFFSVLKNSKGIINQLKTNDEKAWHIFLIQLENELEHCQFEEVLANKIVLRPKGKKHSLWIENKLGKIVKVENGGYQPMLTNVKTANFKKIANSVEIKVLFESQQEFVGRWIITKEHLNED